MTVSERTEKLPVECDVAFIIALREEMEYAEIFHDMTAEPLINEWDLEVHKRKIATRGGEGLNVFTLLIDDQGPENAAIATTNFLHCVRPKLIILIGISGKISADCKLGDVVLASSCDNSLFRAKKKEQKVLPSGKEWPLEALSSHLNTAIVLSPPYYSYDGLTNKEIASLRGKNYIRESPKTLHGPICATPYVVDDPKFADWLKTSRNRNILATDMESVAVVQAAHACGIRNGRVLVLRGISDPADGKKGEVDLVGSGTLRKVAMRNAAQLASHSVCNLLSFEGPQVLLRGYDVTRPPIEAKLSSFKETLEFLREISARISKGEAETDVCAWAIETRRQQQLITNQVKALAQEAYNQEIDKQTQNHECSAVLATLDSTILDYLVGTWIMDCLVNKEISAQLLDVLSNVYPQRFNRFCKAMLAILPDEKRLVDKLITAYEYKPSRRGYKSTQKRERAKAHICYLLGRVRTPQQQSRAAEALVLWRAILCKLPKSEKTSHQPHFQLDRVFSNLETPEERLLLRTICISLILLKHSGESDIYVRACLRNCEFDTLNRGFHLEYYGDIDYDARESMNNTDPIYCLDINTFNFLFEKLSKSYQLKEAYPLRDVELQTVLSLSQHRLAAGALPDAHRQQLLSLLNQYRESFLTSSTLLQSYCGMIREHLTIQNFTRTNLLRKLFELKKLPRTGWNDVDEDHSRKTPNPESVLSHTAGGLILILFCLPDRLGKDDREKVGVDAANKYSKDKIIKIFLAHDFAEAYTGDLTPKQRNDVTKAEERRVNSYIDLFSTYPEFYHFSHFHDWEDFDNLTTINGKIAREIDLLDNFIQLTIESEQKDVTISDLEEWKDMLVKRIETPMSKRILRIITQ